MSGYLSFNDDVFETIYYNVNYNHIQTHSLFNLHEENKK